MRGIAKYSRLYGPWLFNRKPIFSDDQANRRLSMSEKAVFNKLKKFNADGIIANHINTKEQFNVIADMELPMIILGDYFPQEQYDKYIHIRSDSEKIGKLTAEHLLERGYKNYAFCGYDFLNWSRTRGSAFEKRLVENGHHLHIYEQPKSKTKFVWENEQYILAKWLDSLPKPVGVMACNDNRAQQVIDACHIQKLHVPEEVAIIGVDDDEFICDLTDPPLSSIPLDNESAGFEASRLLGMMIKGKPVLTKEITVVPTHVIARHSTDMLAIDDPDVAKALKYIRQNTKDLLQINDVLNVVSVGRRTLEERFKRILKHTVFDEITRCRINHISRLIVETNKSIGEIALDFGYTSEAHISRYFKRIQGVTPLEYRKLYGRS
jgi:LacI family transcriptional regulator